MNLRSRLAVLERAAADPDCPLCDVAGDGRRIVLLPMRLSSGPVPEAPDVPCPACGRVPMRLRLRPMVLGGGKVVPTAAPTK